MDLNDDDDAGVLLRRLRSGPLDRCYLSPRVSSLDIRLRCCICSSHCGVKLSFEKLVLRLNLGFCI